MLIGLLDAAVQSLARRPLAAEEDDWAQQELLPPLLPVRTVSRVASVTASHEHAQGDVWVSSGLG